MSVFDQAQQYIVDPFDGGISLKKDTFVSRLQSKAEQKPSADAIDQALKPAIKIEILLRQLRNLLQVYSSTGDVEKNAGRCKSYVGD